MRSLNKGISPVVTVRAPLPLMTKVEERRLHLNMTRSAFFRGALRVAVGEICCLDLHYGDPFGSHVTCNHRSGGAQ